MILSYEVSARFRRLGAMVLAAGVWVGVAGAAERWSVQYFYDQARSSFTINDIAFPSPQRGIAVGYLTDKGKGRPYAVATADGGAHWSPVTIKEPGLSLFFLNDSIGWMVTPKAIWRTEESGRSWQKLAKTPPDILRVHFLDENHGFAVGAQKSVFETKDGGKNWEQVAAALQPQTTSSWTTYSWITFANPSVGMITGWSIPPRDEEEPLPEWLTPERATQRKEVPHLSLVLDTRNGGQTWVPSTTSAFGRITRVRLREGGVGLALIQFASGFDFPSEVFRIDWGTGKSTRTFRVKDRAITDLEMTPEGGAILAGFQPAGRLIASPIPGKVRILESPDLTNWVDMDVDYRATASVVRLASAGGRNFWAATDTGMILKLSPR